MPVSHIRVPGLSSSYPTLPVQLPAGAWEAEDVDPSAWVPPTQESGDSDGVPGSCFALVVVDQ